MLLEQDAGMASCSKSLALQARKPFAARIASTIGNYYTKKEFWMMETPLLDL